MKRLINRWMLAAFSLAVLPLLGLWLKSSFAQEKPAEEVQATPREGDKRSDTKAFLSGAFGRAAGLRSKGDNGGKQMDGKNAKPMARGMGATANSLMGGRAGMMPGEPDAALQAEQEALAEQENETQRLVSEYRQTEDEKERGWIAGELSKAIAKHFDIRQETRERELKQLEAQVRRLRELHDKRTKEKGQIVQDRVRQLLRDADGLGWGTDSDANDFLRSSYSPRPETVPTNGESPIKGF